MFLVQEKQHIKRLKIVLQSNYLYIILLFTIIIIYLIPNNKTNSIYNDNDTELELIIEDYHIEEDKITLYLKGKEKLIGYYNNELNNIKYGQKVYIKGKLNKPSHNTIPNNFDYHDYLLKQNIYYQINIKEIKIKEESKNIIYILKNKIVTRINKIDNTGYMMGFILGDKKYIPDSEYKIYQNIGIAHLFAISGMHISLITCLLMKLLKRVKIEITYLVISIILIIYGFNWVSSFYIEMHYILYTKQY